MNDRLLTPDETKYILSILEKEISEELLFDLFAKYKVDEPPKFNANDYFNLPVGSCCDNKKEGYTTIGIYLCNRFLIEPHFSDIFGYINKPMTGPQVDEIEETIAKALYNDKIETTAFADFLDRIQWLGGNGICSVICPSITAAMLTAPEGFAEERARLIEINKEGIKAGDPVVGVKLEKSLLDYSDAKIKSDPGYENFASRSKISLTNHYRTMQVMKGTLKNNATGEYQINLSNYNEGITKEEYASIADSAVAGAHARAQSTAIGGYLAKRSNATLNTVTAGESGSDCLTTEYLIVYLDKFFKQEYLYRYVVEGKTLTLITEDNFDQYANRIVKLRSPMFCHMEEPYYCSKCCGEQPYKIKLMKMGLAISRSANTLLNLNLKKFHDIGIKLSQIDPSKILHFD